VLAVCHSGRLSAFTSNQQAAPKLWALHRPAEACRDSRGAGDLAMRVLVAACGPGAVIVRGLDQALVSRVRGRLC